MREKKWIYNGRYIGLYQELSLDDDSEINKMDVVLCIHDGYRFNFEYLSENSKVQSHFSTSISSIRWRLEMNMGTLTRYRRSTTVTTLLAIEYSI